MLYEWKQGDDTQTHAVPGYIYLVLMLGSTASVANAMSYMGACARSICLLTVSLGMLLFVLLLEAALALTLIYNPSLVDTEVCLPDDAACIERLNSIFKDPSAHAGLPPHLSVLRSGRFFTSILYKITHPIQPILFMVFVRRSTPVMSLSLAFALLSCYYDHILLPCFIR